MANVAGRPNISNKVLDENGQFSAFWYRFMEQMWVRSGGSTDDVTGLRDAIELVELIPTTENIPQDDLLPSIVIKEVEDDLAPRFEFSLTAEELKQLQNIDAIIITNGQWEIVGAFDQSLAIADNVTHNEITGTGDFIVTSGNEVFLNLPTVNTGTSGSLWSDSGTVKVVP